MSKHWYDYFASPGLAAVGTLVDVGKSIYNAATGNTTSTTTTRKNSSTAGKVANATDEALRCVQLCRSYEGYMRFPADHPNYPNGSVKSKCQAYVAYIYYKLGKGYTGAPKGSATSAGQAWATNTDYNNIPIGACLWWSSSGNGHAAIYIGNGKISHAWDGLIRTSELSLLMNSSSYKWIGWGWTGGAKNVLKGSTTEHIDELQTLLADYNTDDLLSGYGIDGFTESSGTETVKIEHISEIEQHISVYPNDVKDKPVDEYTVAFKKWDSETKTGINISDICSSVELTDSTSQVARTLTMDIAQNKYDKYLKALNIQTGDKISVINNNSAEVIFTGVIIQVDRQGLTGAVGISAIDNGKLLTMNHIITQFKNQPGADVISTIANKAGVKRINAPEFISTFTGQMQGKASDIITQCLNQISQENGINYIARVQGDCLVIRSWSENVVVPYFRAASNIAPAPCMQNVSTYTQTEDAKNIATSIQIISNSQVVAEKTSAESEKRWGRTSAGVSYDSTNELVNEDEKALYWLYYGEYSKPSETYSVQCPGSDIIKAGCLLKMYIDGELVRFWVQDVKHEYIPFHVCDLQLQKYHEPLTIEQLKGLYGDVDEGEEKATNDTDTEEEEVEEIEEME